MILNKFLYKLKMLQYDRIEFSERINVNKAKSVIFATIGSFRCL